MFKRKPVRSKKLRDAARGEPCVMCGMQDDTTVLAHLPHNDAGIGMKTDDFIGAFLCARCHNLADGREQPSRQRDYEWRFLALVRTLRRQIGLGNIVILGDKSR